MLQFWINVKNELEYKGISQKELASIIEESYNTLESWINRDRLPNVIQSVKIASALNTTVEYLVTGNNCIISKNKTKIINLLEESIDEIKRL